MNKDMDMKMLSWVPPGCTPQQVRDYFDQIPRNRIPIKGSVGAKYRHLQLYYQIPPGDVEVTKNLFLDSEGQKELKSLIQHRNRHHLEVGEVTSVKDSTIICSKCRKKCIEGSVVVTVTKPDTRWFHPNCFRCITCSELLVDLIYCSCVGGRVWCIRHFMEQERPRCSACDEIISGGEATQAMDQSWHPTHFSCWHCDESLTAKRYVSRDDHPYCIRCYESQFASPCCVCNKTIGIDMKDLSYKEKHWHEECFNCTKCNNSLVDKPFGSKADRIYCSDCYDGEFSARCVGCNEPFRSGCKKMEYKGTQWHDECFKCAECQNPIGAKSFIPRDKNNYCMDCYEQKFATRCCKCNNVISAGGVTYREQHFHKECFCCTTCNTQLAGKKFTTKENNPYCADCFGNLFSKKCATCVKPIIASGIGGSKFVTFEDRNWHNECFGCTSCKTSLLGKGFITDALDILCAECARLKIAN